MSEPFGPPELQSRSREAFVGNETDTDDYSQITQPAKGLGYAASVVQLLQDAGDDGRLDQAIERTAAWLVSLRDGLDVFAGMETLGPVLELYHDVLWQRGEHPYYDNPADLLDMLGDVDGGMSRSAG